MTALLIGCLVALGAAFVTSLVRTAKGPSPADRATGADVGYLIAVAAIAVSAVLTGDTVFLDVVLVATVVGFLATIAFGWFVDRGAG